MRSFRGFRTSWRAAVLAAVAAAASVRDAHAGPADAQPPVRDAADALRATLPPPDVDPFLGVVIDDRSGTALVAHVVAGSAAEIAGVREGDVLARVDATSVSGSADVDRAIRARGVGARVRMELIRDDGRTEITATLGRRRRPDDCFRGSRFELAVVPLRFADDVAPSPDAARLARLLFAKTGAAGPGASLADYYRVQSSGRLDVEGRILAPVTLPLPRANYASQPMGGSAQSAFAAAAAVLESRDVVAAHACDGIAFLYVGETESRPGFALWPHRSTVTVAGRRVPYYVHAADAGDSDAVGVHCHEFGHLLGLPDAYGAAHLSGCGDFCVMAIGHRGGPTSGARSPFSMCAWCRMRLGWIDPVEVDPRTAQRVRLKPISSGGGAVVVPLTPRTDEYLLLEARRREGFDAELPSAGLLVWHVGGAAPPGKGPFGGYVELVAAHGVDCIDSALVHTGEIAFPTRRARDLTPDTTPSVRATATDAFPAYLTSIDAEADGSVVLTIGVPRVVAQAAPAPAARSPLDGDGFVVRVDPITGVPVKLFTVGGDVPPLPVPADGGAGRR